MEFAIFKNAQSGGELIKNEVDRRFCIDYNIKNAQSGGELIKSVVHRRFVQRKFRVWKEGRTL